MAVYDSSYTGVQIDTAVGAVITAQAAGGIANVNGINTILEDYLTVSNAASTYLTQSDASSTYLTQTSASSTYALKTGTLNNSGIATSWTDTWSDGTNSHPWYGLDMRYHNTGIYSTTLSNYFGLTLHTNAGYLVMNASGNVGIGTTSPDYKLTVNGAIWIQAGSAAGSNTNRLTTTAGMPGNMQYNVGRRGVQIFANGIAMCDPYNGNTNSDAGWVRHIETTSNDGYLEIGVGDDGSEMIIARQYNTSNGINKQLILMNASGHMVTNQDIYILHATNASMGTWTTNPRIVFGEGSNASQDYVQGVALAYTDYDSYRASKGLKVLDYDGSDGGNVWFEAQGQMYSKGFNNTSSRTVKHNINSFNEMGDILDQLEPVTFEYNDIPGQLRYGLIFEDTIDILPTICEESGESKTINYVDLVPILLKEIQSLRRRVKLLENN